MLKKNSIVDVYSDYQTENIQIGTGILKKRVKKGLPFILDDEPTEAQFIYGYELWHLN